MSKPGADGADLVDLANSLLKNGPHKVLPTARRVRAIHNHTIIVDTTKTLFVWEHPYYPQIYVPYNVLQNCSARDKKEITKDDKTAAALVEITIPAKHGLDEVKTDRSLRFSDDESNGPLAGMIRIEFGSMDEWLEEDLPIYVHPKDPFKRVDILTSTRPIEVKVAGKTVAKTTTSAHLYETGLPTRYYMPLSAVDQSVLRPSDLVTKCPYKGEAEYYHVVVDGQSKENIVWYYRLPTHESAAVAGLVCFYNEKVDIILDGEPQK